MSSCGRWFWCNAVKYTDWNKSGWDIRKLNLHFFNINTTSICVHFIVSLDSLSAEKLLPAGRDGQAKQWHPLMLRTNTQISELMHVCAFMFLLSIFWPGLWSADGTTVLTHTHYQVFCWLCPWSRSEKSPFRSVPSPRTPCCFCTLSPSQQTLTPACQGLFPKIRLNMNIHKQNGTPRLWKLSKTYLHLILKEVPTPTLPPFTESLLPPFGPL